MSDIADSSIQKALSGLSLLLQGLWLRSTFIYILTQHPNFFVYLWLDCVMEGSVANQVTKAVYTRFGGSNLMKMISFSLARWPFLASQFQENVQYRVIVIVI